MLTHELRTTVRKFVFMITRLAGPVFIMPLAKPYKMDIHKNELQFHQNP